ncbi:unnamed protein product, partial [Prorocentrum cordatum]
PRHAIPMSIRAETRVEICKCVSTMIGRSGPTVRRLHDAGNDNYAVVMAIIQKSLHGQARYLGGDFVVVPSRAIEHKLAHAGVGGRAIVSRGTTRQFPCLIDPRTAVCTRHRNVTSMDLPRRVAKAHGPSGLCTLGRAAYFLGRPVIREPRAMGLPRASAADIGDIVEALFAL